MHENSLETWNEDQLLSSFKLFWGPRTLGREDINRHAAQRWNRSERRQARHKHKTIICIRVGGKKGVGCILCVSAIVKNTIAPGAQTARKAGLNVNNSCNRLLYVHEVGGYAQYMYNWLYVVYRPTECLNWDLKWLKMMRFDNDDDHLVCIIVHF